MNENDAGEKQTRLTFLCLEVNKVHGSISQKEKGSVTTGSNAANKKSYWIWSSYLRVFEGRFKCDRNQVWKD